MFLVPCSIHNQLLCLPKPLDACLTNREYHWSCVDVNILQRTRCDMKSIDTLLLYLIYLSNVNYDLLLLSLSWNMWHDQERNYILYICFLLSVNVLSLSVWVLVSLFTIRFLALLYRYLFFYFRCPFYQTGTTAGVFPDVRICKSCLPFPSFLLFLLVLKPCFHSLHLFWFVLHESFRSR